MGRGGLPARARGQRAGHHVVLHAQAGHALLPRRLQVRPPKPTAKHHENVLVARKLFACCWSWQTECLWTPQLTRLTWSGSVPVLSRVYWCRPVLPLLILVFFHVATIREADAALGAMGPLRAVLQPTVFSVLVTFYEAVICSQLLHAAAADGAPTAPWEDRLNK